MLSGFMGFCSGGYQLANHLLAEIAGLIHRARHRMVDGTGRALPNSCFPLKSSQPLKSDNGLYLIEFGDNSQINCLQN
jgi:hypothetical protein